MEDPRSGAPHTYVFRNSGLKDLQDKRTGHKPSSLDCFNRVCGAVGTGVAIPPPVAAHTRNLRAVEPSHFNPIKRVTPTKRPEQYQRKGASLGAIMLRRISKSSFGRRKKETPCRMKHPLQ